MCNQPTQCTEAASPALPTEWQWVPVISGITYKRHTDPLGPDSQPVLRSAPTWWQVPFCQPQGGTLTPSGRWCLRELGLSVQLELEASKDSPSRNSAEMCSPTWSQLGELRWTGSSQTPFFLSPRWRGVAGSSRSEQLAPDPPCSPETNSEPYASAFAIEEGQMACSCPWGQVSWQWDSGLPALPTSLLRSGILLPSPEAWPGQRVREGEGPWGLLGRAGAPAETWFQAHALILSECFYSD